MSDAYAYTRKEYVRAVNLSGVSACTLMLASAIPAAGWDIVGAIPFAFLFGLPIVWITVGPILYYRMRSQVTWMAAATLGTGIGLLLVSLGFLRGQSRRRYAAENDSFNYQLGGGDFVRDIDGTLTEYGWQVLIQNNVLFVIMCLLCALIVRYSVGPGREMK